MRCSPLSLSAILRRFTILALGVLPPCGSTLLAQAARPAGSAATDEKSENTVVLSPFQVDSRKDVGYLAQNTLAGSRLNTPLADTPASISVFTSEFLSDIDASDVLKALEYSVNFQEDRTNAGGNPQQENDINIQARGFAGGGFRQASRNYFTWFLNSDSYNTESITFSRGPNSILFGLGDPGGIVNTTTMQTRFANRSKVNFRFDEYGSARVSADTDMRISNKFGLRFAGLVEDGKTWRELAYKNQRRAYAAGTWRATAKTTVRFDAEYADIKQLVSLPFTGRDRFGGWVTAGKPVYSGGATYPAGTARLSANATTPRLTLDYDRGTAVNWQNQAVGSANPNPPGNIPLTDFNFVPKTVDLRGPAATTDNPLYTYSAYLEHELIDNLFIELAGNVQWEKRDWRNPVQEGRAGIFADPNAFLPGGAPNPNVGTFYIEDQAIQRVRSRDVENFRLTATYEKDFANWMGRHRWVALASREKLETLTRDYIESNITPLNPALFPNLRSEANFINRRTYLNFNGGNRSYKADPWADRNTYQIIDPTFGLVGTVTPEFVATAIRPTKEVVTSTLVGGQSYFIKNRLAVTYGFRTDDVDQNPFVETIDPVKSVVSSGVLGAGRSASGNTRSLGAVLKVWRGLALAYNTAETFLPQTPIDIRGNSLGNIKGDGFDVGARWSLLDGRVYATATYYESNSENRGAFNSLNTVRDINQIWEAIEGPSGPRRLDQISTQDTRDDASQGWEYELVGNITDSWSVRMNYATPRNVQSNINPRTKAYIEEFRTLWTSAANASLIIPNVTTDNSVATRLTNVIDRRLAGDARAEGRQGRGVRDEVFTVFSNYKFRTGALRGFSAGYGLKGYGNNVLAYVGTTGRGSPVFGRGYWISDLKLSYEGMRRTFGKKVEYKVQLNVANLFDGDNVIFNQANSTTGVKDVYYFINPRTASLSLSFSF